MAQGKNIANREVCNAIIRDYKTKKPLLYVDFANTTTTEMTGESVFAYGGWGHPKRVTFTGEKAGTFTMEFQIQPFQLYAITAGCDVDATATYAIREAVTATEDGKLTMAQNVVAPTDGGTINIFAADDDCGTDLNAANAATVADKVITLTGIEADTDYVVYYYVNVPTDGNVQHINIKNTTFPKAICVDADTIYKAEDDTEVAMKFKVWKCQPQSQFTLANANTGDPGTFTLTCDIMADENGNMLDMIAIEEE